MPSQIQFRLFAPCSRVAQTMYPAKFTFDLSAAPHCLNDVLIFKIAVTPSPRHPTRPT